jgi:hypothetical protein
MLFFQILHDACRGIESEGAPAGEHHGVNLLDHVNGIEQIRFARAWRTAAHIHTSGGTVSANQDRATRRGIQILRMPDFDSPNVGKLNLFHQGILKYASLFFLID